MSERPTPELEALATQLFAAGRAERPGPALGRRLALIDPRHTRQPTPAERSMTGAARSVARVARSATNTTSSWVALRSRLARGAALAALVASGAGIVLVSQMDVRAVSISREHASSRSRSALPTPAPQAAASRPEAPQVAASRAAVPQAAASRADAPQAAVSPVASVEQEDTVAADVRSSSAASRVGGGSSATSSAAAAAARFRPRGGANAEHTAPAAPPARAPSASPQAPESGAPPRVEPEGAPRITSQSPSPQRPLTLLGELDLLKQARAALRSGQPRHAIELLETHRRERGGSELVAEATLLRIEALAALGERTVASDLALRFVRENPHSALGDRAKSFILVAAPHAP